MAGNALDQHAVAVLGERQRAEGYALIEAAPLPDDGGFADDHACPVIDEEFFINGRARMDIDAGGGMGHLGNDARDDRHAEVVQLVRDAVVRHGEQRGVTENGFPGAGRGGIALIGRLGVGREQPADVGEALHELHGLAHGHFFAAHAVGGVACTGEAAAAPDLFGQLAENGVQIGREVVAHGFHMHAGNAEIAGKERGLEARHDLAEFFERGHGGIVQRMVQNRLKRGRRAQLFHDEIQIGHGRWRYGSEWFHGVPREGYSPPASEGWGDSPGSRSSNAV